MLFICSIISNITKRLTTSLKSESSSQFNVLIASPKNMGRKFRFKKGLAVVTGASSGIGLELAILLAERGMEVIGVARREELLEKLADKISNNDKVKENGGAFIPLKCDVTLQDDLELVLKKVNEYGGKLDLLVNNAGRGYDSLLMDGDLKYERELLELNVISPLALSRIMHESLSNSNTAGAPTIVNVSSIVGYYPLQAIGFYSATKAALSSMTISMRSDLKSSGIHVIGCHPGMTSTAFNVASERNVESARPKLNQKGRSARKQAKIIVNSIRWKRKKADPIESTPYRILSSISSGIVNVSSKYFYRKSHPINETGE